MCARMCDVFGSVVLGCAVSSVLRFAALSCVGVMSMRACVWSSACLGVRNYVCVCVCVCAACASMCRRVFVCA